MVFADSQDFENIDCIYWHWLSQFLSLPVTVHFEAVSMGKVCWVAGFYNLPHNFPNPFFNNKIYVSSVSVQIQLLDFFYATEVILFILGYTSQILEKSISCIFCHQIYNISSLIIPFYFWFLSLIYIVLKVWWFFTPLDLHILTWLIEVVYCS